MLFIRRETVVNLPLGSVILMLVMGLLLGDELSSPSRSTGGLMTLAALSLLFTSAAVMQFRVTRRVGDEIRVYGAFRPERSAAVEVRLRASITRSAIYPSGSNIELVEAEQQLFGTTVAASLGVSAKGRKRAEAVAEALRLPLIGELPEPDSPP